MVTSENLNNVRMALSQKFTSLGENSVEKCWSIGNIEDPSKGPNFKEERLNIKEDVLEFAHRLNSQSIRAANSESIFTLIQLFRMEPGNIRLKRFPN